mmetsp:Transcript_37966/g.113412  ORF Transcript_37966/g.113412 Transcript_37966/m.113412 type:complete len:83 (+) Transcript_37966:86-334(+)
MSTNGITNGTGRNTTTRQHDRTVIERPNGPHENVLPELHTTLGFGIKTYYTKASAVQCANARKTEELLPMKSKQLMLDMNQP